MLEIILYVLAFSTVMALCGTIGERMMSYGRENGLVKDNYDFSGQDFETKRKTPDVGASSVECER